MEERNSPGHAWLALQYLSCKGRKRDIEGVLILERPQEGPALFSIDMGEFLIEGVSFSQQTGHFLYRGHASILKFVPKYFMSCFYCK